MFGPPSKINKLGDNKQAHVIFRPVLDYWDLEPSHIPIYQQQYHTIGRDYFAAYFVPVYVENCKQGL